MTDNKNKLLQVSEFINNGDEHLGIRRLIDCVLDTKNISFFHQTLQLIEQHEQDKESSVFATKVIDFITEISNFSLPNSNIQSGDLLLDVKDISKQYKNSSFKISPLSFQLKYSEIVGLVGENGNGKTTLLKLLTKDLNPDNGSINYHIPNQSLFELRSQLVYIPQRIPRWYGSLMDNLQFTLSSHQVKGEDNLIWAELIIARLGLRPYKHLGWNRISSGYRTRFEIAKSLLRQPKLMLLDEPLSNLDIISQQTILQDLKFLSESKTQPFGLVLSSQQLYEVEKIADLVIFLKQGNPKYQLKNASENDLEMVYEIETNVSREELSNIFKSLEMSQLNYNGGVFIAHFKPGTSNQSVFKCIAEHDLKLNSIRNISQSSRRFFIN